jgi:hypothetical protein
MKKILLTLLFVTPIAFAEEYPTCNPEAADAETSCPVCYAPDDDTISSAPAEEQVVCDTSA